MIAVPAIVPCGVGIPAASLRTGARRRGMQQDGTEWAALLAAAQAGDSRAMARFLTQVTPLIRAVVRARGQPAP